MSSKDGSTNALEIYQFKIALKYNRPQIWRRIQVPEYFSFFDLHVAIEDLFKIKSSSHLHKFEMVQSRRFFIPFNGNFQLDEYIGIPIEALADYCNILPEKETKIGEQFSIIRSKCLYTYGFNSERVSFVFIYNKMQLSAYIANALNYRNMTLRWNKFR